jgi:riboflavin synthase
LVHEPGWTLLPYVRRKTVERLAENMFTGLIEEIGSVQSVRSNGGGKSLTIRTKKSFLLDAKIDDSIAVNGTCLTIVRKTAVSFTVDAVEETLKKTTTGALRVGSLVNLERALKFSDRLGGHFVLGHVDTTGTIAGIAKKSPGWMFEIEFEAEFRKYVIPVGSIAVDGISLTVAEKKEGSVLLAIIPHTVEKTTLGSKKTGEKVNIEFDYFGKYIEQFINAKQ